MAGLYHITGLSVIRRMELQCPNKLKSLQLYSIYPIFSAIIQLVSNQSGSHWTALTVNTGIQPHVFRKLI